MASKKTELSCVSCGVLNCYRRDKDFPEFCLTAKARPQLETATAEYINDPQTAAIAKAAAEVEGVYYGKLTRVEEIVAFAKRVGYSRIGIATCIGLINEAKIFEKILQAKGLQGYAVLCKVGAVDKTEIGVSPEFKVQKGCHESMCNPVLQARLLNEWQADLNVVVGLCVGHDSLFIKYSDAPVTTLVTKDRVLGHNPAAALYTSGFYYKRLLQQDE